MFGLVNPVKITVRAGAGEQVAILVPCQRRDVGFVGFKIISALAGVERPGGTRRILP